MPPEEWSHQELLEACAGSSSAEAWEEFVRRFNDLITRVAFRTAGHYVTVTSELLDDLVQEVYLKLCASRRRVLASCASPYPDAVFGFIKTVVANTVHDHFKAQSTQKRGAGKIVTIDDPSGDFQSRAPASSENAEKKVLLRQIDEALTQSGKGEINERDRNIFWLYYMQGWTASAIAAIPGLELTAKGVESTILRATRLVRDRIVGPAAANR